MTEENFNHTLGVADNLVAKWECGIGTPTSFNLVCWAEVLGGRVAFVLDKAQNPEMSIDIAKNDNKQNIKEI